MSPVYRVRVRGEHQATSNNREYHRRKRVSISPSLDWFACAKMHHTPTRLLHREQFTALHIINEAPNGHALWNKGRSSEERDIVSYGLFQVLEREEVNGGSVRVKL